MAINIGLNLYRNPINNSLQSGYDPNKTVFTHGDEYVAIIPEIGSNSVIEKQFLGGAGGYIESLGNGASTSNSSKWDFNYTDAGVPFTGYTDAQRGKVLRNDYGVALGQPQIDAIISMTAAASIPENTLVYWSYNVKYDPKDSGNNPIPETGLEQVKISRGITTTKTIQDSVSNNKHEQFCAIEFSGSGLKCRVENAAGVATGTITSATTTSATDAAANMTPNVFTGMLVTVTKTSDNSKQYIKCSGNTATTLNFASPITLPTAGDTFSVGSDASQYDYGGANPVFANGWIHFQATVFTGTQGQADGYIRHSVRQGNTVNTGFTPNVPIYGSSARASFLTMFQGYMKNGTSTIASQNIYADDVYTQVGSDKRVYLTNNATYSSATIREIQNWSTWSSGGFSCSINLGAINSSGTYYLHWISGDSTVIHSKSIEISV